MLDLYKNIKALREARNMSQEELAIKTGYTSRSSIAKIEGGDVDLSQSKIMLFAKALGTTPQALMGWDSDAPEGLFPINVRTTMEIPIFRNIPASCGFGSWAEDEVVDYISLPTSIYKFNKHKKYFGQIAEGDSMINAGIEDGDILVFESYNNPEDNMIGVFTLYNNTCYCKRFKKVDNKYYLVSANENYLPIEITPDMDFRMVGLLKYVVKEYEWGV